MFLENLSNHHRGNSREQGDAEGCNRILPLSDRNGCNHTGTKTGSSELGGEIRKTIHGQRGAIDETYGGRQTLSGPMPLVRYALSGFVTSRNEAGRARPLLAHCFRPSNCSLAVRDRGTN